MFGIDSPELLVIAIVALVVIGPKELPGLLRTWGRWMAQMRGMAAEFRGHVDEMVRQSELDEVKKQLESVQDGLDLKSLDPSRQIRDAIQDGVAEGEKAMTDAKAALDNPLAEPESAPQIAAEPETTPVAASAEAAPAVEPAPAASEPTPIEQSPVEHRPAKAAAE
ncbi:Sec-independent protein translocase protein TatB [Enhydrobacter sp.]|jgi:sec-independent protein translocase protein TatB|uniref:Sec-independent protein translocase protein TatB n=1 Tax=Enhydrobacter sp. TaxID=1894999 RepID=UPI002606228B|nr:Sec-independent protein translocase protein TatB [Enhydrobacter sp.]WIM12270.1 MAG: Twin-arginine translocation protein TatB [Enhydrobacter sp.]